MTKVETLLREYANEYAAALSELHDEVSDRHFKRGSAYSEVEVHSPCSFKTMRDIAINLGTVLREDEEIGLVIIMVKGGIGGMSPVILLALIDGVKVSLGAYSKEGLIPQHAAKDSVRMFARAISNNQCSL